MDDYKFEASLATKKARFQTNERTTNQPTATPMEAAVSWNSYTGQQFTAQQTDSYL